MFPVMQKCVRDSAAAIGFYPEVFGAVEKFRLDQMQRRYDRTATAES